MGSDNHSQTVKAGNRLKRQRSSSPFGFAAAASDISSWSGTSCTDEYCYNNSISFPTTLGEIIYESTEEEEEEEEETDMANCLIMLAQGDCPRSQIIQHKIGHKFQKLNTTSRKFVATVTCNNNKTGFYAYECKTCNRSFPSFQALGGHRASHKKILLEAEKKSVKIKDDDFDSDSHIQKGNKIHECSICGSEFISGQALGGHMRRHRAAANNNNNNNINNNSGDDRHVKPAAVAVAVAATRSILPLDLNLPAPEDDHHIGFGTTQQSLLLSAPALVDCHY